MAPHGVRNAAFEVLPSGVQQARKEGSQIAESMLTKSDVEKAHCGELSSRCQCANKDGAPQSLNPTQITTKLTVIGASLNSTTDLL